MKELLDKQMTRKRRSENGWRTVCVFGLVFSLLSGKKTHAQDTTYLGTFGSPGSGSGQLLAPSLMHVDPATGNLLVADLGNNRVVTFRASGAFVSETDGGGRLNSPADVLIDPATQNRIVTNYADGATPVVLDSQGNYLSSIGTFGQASGQTYGPVGMALTAEGRLYMVDRGSQRIDVFQRGLGADANQFTHVTDFGGPGSNDGEFGYADGLALGGNGYLYIADTTNDRIEVFDTRAGDAWVKSFGITGTGNGEFSSPFGLAVAPSGNVFVADYTNQRIQIFDANGGYLSQFTSGNGSLLGADGIAIGANGTVYVGDYDNGNIQYFHSTFAIAAVPELADVWQFVFVIGAGGILLVRTRRVRRK